MASWMGAQLKGHAVGAMGVEAETSSCFQNGALSFLFIGEGWQKHE